MTPKNQDRDWGDIDEMPVRDTMGY